MTLRESQIKDFEKKLTSKKDELEKQIKDSKKGLDFGDDTDHFEEEEDETEEMANYLAMKKVLDEKIEHIDRALARIKNGTYGICQNCGKEIDIKVLDAEPESNLCRDCKSQ
ncbi:MAG: TraR/DksA C4-type zinc finger protein [Patescibacteria group bacterium]